MAIQYDNIKQLLEAFYGAGNIRKTDAPVSTVTTGVLNVIFGSFAFSQLNNEANVFGLLPKYPWQHSGWRAITADAGSTAAGGVGETASIPDTIKPTFAEITVPTRQVSHTFQNTYIQEGKVKKGDDAIGDMDFLRGYFAVLHAKRINEMLLRDVDTLVTVGFDSIDRVTASSVGATAGLYTAGDEDIYGIDRSTDTWADAALSHNSTVDRTLNDQIIRDMLIGTLKNNGARTNIILTGDDTLSRIYGIYDTQIRYQGALKKDELIQIGVNGVMTDEGQSFGVKVATLYNVPLFSSQAVTQDTISRIYMLDTTIQEETGVPRLGIALMYPTMYYETGMAAQNADPFVLDNFTTKGMYYTAGEIVCTFFKAQGSIRDLK